MKTKKFNDYIIYKDGKIYSLRWQRFLKPTINHSGYYRINLRINNQTKYYYIHRLVAEAFIPNPKNLSEVNHKDLDKNNNHVENLEWVTHQNNMIDARKKKKWKPSKNEKPSPIEGYSYNSGKKCKIGNQEFNSLNAAMRYLNRKWSSTSCNSLIKKGIIILIK